MSVSRDQVQRWLDAYVEAWKSYEHEAIEALFSDDVRYRYHPYDEWITGRRAVADSWLAEGDYAEDEWGRDAPGTYDASYEAVAVDGDVAVATGTSTYLTEPGGPVKTVYYNCFVMRFDDDGRCREFTEHFMERPDP